MLATIIDVCAYEIINYLNKQAAKMQEVMPTKFFECIHNLWDEKVKVTWGVTITKKYF